MRSFRPGPRSLRVMLLGVIAAAGAWSLMDRAPTPHGTSILMIPAVLAQEPPPCGCPKMPVLATSDKPAAGHAEFETNLSAIEQALSNRYEMYPGGWDDAMVAWAHELDPSGALKIWDRPAPAKKRDAPALEEGLVTGLLLRISTPRDADPRTSGSPSLKAQQEANQLAFHLVHTLARINKYGEPQRGLRQASLAILRFFADKAANISYDATEKVPRAITLRQIGQAVRGVTAGYVLGGIPDGAHLTTRDVRQTFTKGLALDALDLANAALDVYWATDDPRRERMVRPTNEGTSGDLNGWLRGLPSVASGWSAFGARNEGPAQEAISCRAYSLLVALLDTRVQGTRLVRDVLFANLKSALFNLGNAARGGTRQVDLPEVRVYAAAVAVGGVADEAEADQRAADFFAESVGYSKEKDPQKIEAVRALRTLVTYAGGERDTFRGQMSQRIADLIAETQRRAAEENRQPEDAFVSFLELWNSSTATKPPSGDFSCGPDEGDSDGHIFLYAITNKGLQQILHPYVGVPMIVEVQYDPPEGATEKMLQLSLGGQSQVMTFKRVDPKGYIYRSDPFVPGDAR